MKLWRLILVLVACSMGEASLGWAQGAHPVGTVITMVGKVELWSANGKGGALKLGQPVFANDEIKTGANGRVQLILSDGTMLKLNYSTDITLKDKDIRGKRSPRGIALIKIALGDLWARVTHKKSRLEFETPSAVAAVKGTQPVFSVAPDGTTCIKLIEGRLLVTAGGCHANMEKMRGVCLSRGEKACDASYYVLHSTATFADNMKGPSSATVTMQVRDAQGKQHVVKVQYGPSK